MPCESCVTYRATQNPDTPNLPFAQVRYNPMWSGTINPDRPDLPFAQSRTGGQSPHVALNSNYVVYWKDGGETTLNLTNSAADYYRSLGHNVVLVGTDTGTTITGSGVTKSQVTQIIRGEYQDDIDLLHSHAVKAGERSESARLERERIEAKVNENKSEHQNIWDSIGQKADSGHSHGGGNGGCNCGFFDVPCQMKCGVERLIPYILIGGLAIYTISRKKR